MINNPLKKKFPLSLEDIAIDYAQHAVSDIGINNRPELLRFASDVFTVANFNYHLDNPRNKTPRQLAEEAYYMVMRSYDSTAWAVALDKILYRAGYAFRP